MNDNLSNSGQQQTTPTRVKQSFEGLLPPEKSSTKSNLPHQQAAQAKQPPKTQSDKVSAASALLRGEQASSTEPDGVGAAAPTSLGEERTDTGAELPNSPAGILAGEGGVAVPSPLDASGVGTIPETFDPKFLAEHLGIEPKELYERLQITTQEGDTVTFGEWKDRTTEQVTAVKEHIKREQVLDQRESAMNTTLDILNSVGTEVAKQFPQAAKVLADHNKQTQAQERRLAMSAMPELQDTATRKQFTDDIVGYLEPYGFRAAQLNIMDHRILLALRDAMKTKKQLEQLLSFDPEANQDPPRTQRPQGKRKRAAKSQQLMEQAATGGKSDKVAAVSNLIRSKGR